MLVRLDRTPIHPETMKQSYQLHLQRLCDWLAHQANMKVLFVRYNDLISDPETQAERINRFLSGTCQVVQMVAAVDPALYRNRGASALPDRN